MLSHRDGLDTGYLALQILDLVYRLPWAPVDGRPETEQLARYAPEGLADMFSTTVNKVMGEAEIRRVGAERLETSIRATIGKPVKDLWWPIVVAWARKPE